MRLWRSDPRTNANNPPETGATAHRTRRRVVASVGGTALAPVLLAGGGTGQSTTGGNVPKVSKAVTITASLPRTTPSQAAYPPYLEKAARALCRSQSHRQSHQ